jgi:hypothetical protein
MMNVGICFLNLNIEAERYNITYIHMASGTYVYLLQRYTK